MPGPQTSLELVLRDGALVKARTLNGGDRDYVAEAYRQLSPEARYHRFWTVTGEIGERMLDRLLKDDPGNHEIWCVYDPARDFTPLGAASWWRSKVDPKEAEFSVTVLDAEQNRGIATLLLAILWLTAFRNGITSLVGHVMPENQTACAWMRRTGASGLWDGYMNTFRWQLEDLDVIPPTRAGVELAEWLARLSPRLLD
ncbi:MAG: GNAT family N-acetyltransferase [Luteolibacter sp.]